MMQIVLPLTQPLVYLALIILFHRGEYPPTPAPSGTPRRRLLESALILGAILTVRLLKALYPAVFTWDVYAYTYLATGLCLLFAVKTLDGVELNQLGFTSPRDRPVLRLFAGVLVLLLVGGVSRHMLLDTPLPYLNKHLLSGVVAGPFVEETVFRGLIQTRLLGRQIPARGRPRRLAGTAC